MDRFLEQYGDETVNVYVDMVTQPIQQTQQSSADPRKRAPPEPVGPPPPWKRSAVAQDALEEKTIMFLFEYMLGLQI